MSRAGNLPDWGGTFPLGERLQRALGCTVRLGNDVHVANLAEQLIGAGRGHPSFLRRLLGDRRRRLVILEGRQWQGRGAAGEIGHMVVARNGAPCTCGRNGCVEAYAGRAAMELTARRRNGWREKTRLFRIMERQGRPRLTSGVPGRTPSMRATSWRWTS